MGKKEPDAVTPNRTADAGALVPKLGETRWRLRTARFQLIGEIVSRHLAGREIAEQISVYGVAAFPRNHIYSDTSAPRFCGDRRRFKGDFLGGRIIERKC